MPRRWWDDGAWAHIGGDRSEIPLDNVFGGMTVHDCRHPDNGDSSGLGDPGTGDSSGLGVHGVDPRESSNPTYPRGPYVQLTGTDLDITFEVLHWNGNDENEQTGTHTVTGSFDQDWAQLVLVGDWAVGSYVIEWTMTNNANGETETWKASEGQIPRGNT